MTRGVGKERDEKEECSKLGEVGMEGPGSVDLRAISSPREPVRNCDWEM